MAQRNITQSFGISKIKLPTEICITPDETGLENLIKHVYPHLCKKSFDQQICNRAFLAATNERVDFINQKIMEDFKSDSCEIYLSADSVQDPSQASIYPTEFLNSLTPSGLPPPFFVLKKVFTYNTHTEFKSKRRTSKWNQTSCY